MRVLLALVAVVAATLLGGAVTPMAQAAGHSEAPAIVDFDPASCDTYQFLDRNDDRSTGSVDIGFVINFFGEFFDELYVNNNGNLTFDAPMGTFTPFPLTSTATKIVAPFFADVDTRHPDSAVLSYGRCTFEGRPAFFASWDGVGVGYFGAHADKLNQFQVILADRSDTGPMNFDILFNYDQIQWETGDASGGSGGLGGSPARAGFSNGVDTSFEMPGSGISGAFLDSNLASGLIWNSLNSGGMAGRYRFAVRNGEVPTGHSISGTVFSNNMATGNELSGVLIEVCNTSGFCNLTTSNVVGGYSVGGLENGIYNVRAFPPGNLNPAQIGPLTVANNNLFDQDVVVTGPLAPPPGTVVNNASLGVIPTVVIGQPFLVTHIPCQGATDDQATISFIGEYGGMHSETFGPAPLGPSFLQGRPSVPFTGPAFVRVAVPGCEPVEFNIYIDPSGFVRTPSGAPIVGATVTLYRSDTGLPGTFVEVPHGSVIMSPANRSNPDLTDATGHFGWDTIAGYYKVRAAKADCHAVGDPSQPYVETDVLPVPPPVTDIDLRLDGPGCEASDTTPPVITVPDGITVEATGPEGTAVTYTASAVDDVDGLLDVSCAPASGSVFALGLTTVVICTAEDAAGNDAEESFGVTVVDTTAASLTVPDDITVDATSPAGAVVWYTAGASDIVDGNVAVVCSPASGSTFAIGDTTVTCNAEDSAGNLAQATFDVHVAGAAEQLGDLIVASTGVGPGTSLADKARSALGSLEADDMEDACGTLRAYLNELRAQAGRKVTAAQAADLKARVDQIRAVLGC